MIIADYLDYDTAKIYDQGKSQTCVAHAFFTLLSEHIQQQTGKEVEFDFYKYHEEMEEERGSQLRVKYLCSKAMKDGFRTKTGELVKIGSYRKYMPYNKWDWFCEHIQSTGPQLFAVKRYKGHKLNPRDTDIVEMPTSEQLKNRKKEGHMMMVRGFDYANRLVKFQNSWGKDDSVKWMPHQVFVMLCKYVYYIKNVTIEP